MILGNSVGLIDSDYQGPLKVSLWNSSDQAFALAPGDRMAQLVFLPIVLPTFDVVSEYEESVRAEGGFGSTGKGVITHDQ